MKLTFSIFDPRYKRLKIFSTLEALDRFITKRGDAVKGSDITFLNSENGQAVGTFPVTRYLETTDNRNFLFNQ